MNSRDDNSPWYRIHLVMPSNVSQARKDITQAFGTEIIYSDPMEGSDGAIVKVRKLVAEEPDRYFYPDQYNNPANWRAHYDRTADEIYDATDGQVSVVVMTMGTRRVANSSASDRSAAFWSARDRRMFSAWASAPFVAFMARPFGKRKLRA